MAITSSSVGSYFWTWDSTWSIQDSILTVWKILETVAGRLLEGWNWSQSQPWRNNHTKVFLDVDSEWRELEVAFEGHQQVCWGSLPASGTQDLGKVGTSLATGVGWDPLRWLEAGNGKVRKLILRVPSSLRERGLPAAKTPWRRFSSGNWVICRPKSLEFVFDLESDISERPEVNPALGLCPGAFDGGPEAGGDKGIEEDSPASWKEDKEVSPWAGGHLAALSLKQKFFPSRGQESRYVVEDEKIPERVPVLLGDCPGIAI